MSQGSYRLCQGIEEPRAHLLQGALQAAGIDAQLCQAAPMGGYASGWQPGRGSSLLYAYYDLMVPEQQMDQARQELQRLEPHTTGTRVSGWLVAALIAVPTALVLGLALLGHG